ncbi:hypothetical protein ATO6_01280 [Oceanicola sp. 22II-s10i]|nr:hypothetical protein ATO6_01280 [Oceanicola sp. 22II-s10i]
MWLAEGPVVDGMAGFHYPTRMALIRLPEGGLFVWSPTALTEELRAATDDLGPIQDIVAPNALHHLFLSDWAEAYPAARIHGTVELKDKRPDISFTTSLDAAAPEAWAGHIDQTIFPNRIANEAVFFHRASGTVLITDLIQQLPRDWYSGWRGLVARLDLMTAPRPSVPRKFRLATRDRPAARAAAVTILGWPATTLVMAHGTPVRTDAARTLAQAFDWLVPPPASSG